MAGDVSGPFRVVHSGRIRAQLATWAKIAVERGLGTEYKEALQTIQERLRTEPLAFGDPQFHFRHLDLLMYRGLKAPLVVYYGVDKDNRLVFIQKYELLPRNRLGPQP